MQLSGSEGYQNGAPGEARESLEIEVPRTLGPTQREQAAFELALAYAEAASPTAPAALGASFCAALSSESCIT